LETPLDCKSGANVILPFWKSEGTGYTNAGVWNVSNAILHLKW